MPFIYPLEECGLFYFDGPVSYALPLEGVHVAVRIVDTIAEVQVVQFYVNNRPHLIDTRYQFPLDESAAVCGFEAELEDKLLIGEVREKEEARAEYHAALARGETAALLEQDKPNVFSQRIGNIKPYSRVNIRITYVTDLKVESDGAVRFVLPTSVAPRYTPYYLPLAVRPVDYIVVPWHRPWRRCCLGRRVLYREHYLRRVHYDLLPWYDWPYYTPDYVVNSENPSAFSMTVEVEMPSRVTNVTSATHSVRWEPNPADAEGHSASVSFWSEVEPMGKDLVLQIHQHAAHEPHVELEVAPDGSGCAMLTMVPEFDLDPEPTEIVFLVDVSGSMRGDRLQAAIRALQLFLRSLPMTCAFNLYAFQSSFTTMFKGASQGYSKDTLQRALDYVRNSLRAYGGTELLPPLRDIFSRPVARGRSRQLFVLTDGQVTNTSAVIEIVRQNAHNTRVFTVGIGDEVDRSLVEGMARAGTGTAEFIQGSELRGASGVLEGKLINQLKNATLPSITKIIVDWGDLGPVAVPGFFDSVATETTADTAAIPATTAVAVDPNATCLVTFRVKCEQTEKDEDLYVVGSVPALGTWDPSKAHQLYTNAHCFPVWAATVSLPASAGTFNFKFIKKRPDGYLAFETLDNRTATVEGKECTFECGAWNVAAVTTTNIVPADPVAVVASAPPAPTPSPAPAPTPAVSAPPSGPAPVSKFFQTGPAQQRPGVMSFMGARTRGGSVHAVGTGFGVHAPSALAPAVGFGHDASSSQAHGRNADVYQAPFLPSPIFSGNKFVMYALFQPGKLPTGTVRISAEAPGGELVIDVPVTKLSTVGKTLHVLAARALVRDLDEGTSHLHWRQTGTPPSLRSGGSGQPTLHWFRGWIVTEHHHAVGGAGQDRGSAWNLMPVTPPAMAVRAEMIDLGLRFGITSTYTSFVAVERWRDGRRGDSDTALPLPSQAPFEDLYIEEEESRSIGYGAAPNARFRSRESSVSSPVARGAPLGGRGRGGASPRSSSSSSSAAPMAFGFQSSIACAPLAPASCPAPSRAPMAAMSMLDGAPAPMMAKLSSSASTTSSLKKKTLSKPAVASKQKSSFKNLEKQRRSSADKGRRLAAPRNEAISVAADACFDEDDASSASESDDEVELATFPDALIAEQDFDGSFPPSSVLAGCIGTSTSALQAAGRSKQSQFGSADESTAIALWTSVYVLAVLQKRWSHFESSWQMVAEKTRSWLLAQLQQVLSIDRSAARAALDRLINEAIASI